MKNGNWVVGSKCKLRRGDLFYPMMKSRGAHTDGLVKPQCGDYVRAGALNYFYRNKMK